jgi:hypothetical protein
VWELIISVDAYVENYLAGALIDREGHVFWRCRTAGGGLRRETADQADNPAAASADKRSDGANAL